MFLAVSAKYFQQATMISEEGKEVTLRHFPYPLAYLEASSNRPMRADLSKQIVELSPISSLLTSRQCAPAL